MIDGYAFEQLGYRTCSMNDKNALIKNMPINIKLNKYFTFSDHFSRSFYHINNIQITQNKGAYEVPVLQISMTEAHLDSMSRVKEGRTKNEPFAPLIHPEYISFQNYLSLKNLQMN